MTGFRIVEFLLMGLSALTVAIAVSLVRRRDRLLAQVRQLAAQLADGDGEIKVPQGPGTVSGVVAALDQIGHRLASLRSSEQGRLEQALRLAEAVLEAMPDPVLVFDGEARVTLFNTASKTLFHERVQIRAPAASLGDPVLQLAAEEASIGFPVASNRVPHVDLVADGVRRRLRVRALPLPGGGPPGAILVLQDVTESDAEAERLRHAAESALFELRPLVDALGASLIGHGGETPGIAEWQAIESVLRDVEGTGDDQPLQRVDLADLVESALDAVALEAQRRRVKIQRWFERPAPTPLTDLAAARRLFLRALRSTLRRRAEGEVLRVEVRNSPRPLVRIVAGVAESSLLDSVLLDRAQIVARVEKHGGDEALTLQFAQLG